MAPGRPPLERGRPLPAEHLSGLRGAAAGPAAGPGAGGGVRGRRGGRLGGLPPRQAGLEGRGAAGAGQVGAAGCSGAGLEAFLCVFLPFLYHFLSFPCLFLSFLPLC